MTASEWVGVAGLVVGLAGGLGGPVLTAVFFGGRITARLASIEKTLEMNRADEVRCRADREAAEDRLRERITDLAGQHEHLRGRVNGHGGGH